MAKRIQIKDYRIKVNLRCWDKLKRSIKGYPVIFRGFSKYKFAVHHQWSNDSVWRVTELSSGLAFNCFGETRLEAVQKAYKSLITHKEQFVKRVQEHKDGKDS